MQFAPLPLLSNSDILANRLHNQRLTSTAFTRPEEVVSWLVAMQAQEYPMAKWAIGLRMPGLKEADVDRAFNEGAILRTHLMRPTWHFVTPADIRWLLALTAPRVHAVNAHMGRRLELDGKIFKHCNDIFVSLLEGGKHLPRTTLRSALEKTGITMQDQRMAYLLMQAELDGIICSGPRVGKQFTYALLDEKAPAARPFHREEALAELSLRYFRSRGPATAHDFSWWSGLTVKDARAGIESLLADFQRQVIDGKEYAFLPGETKIEDKSRITFLLPDYDEYGISYKDRSAMGTQAEVRPTIPVGYQLIIVDGRFGGTWRRTEKKGAIIVETDIHPSVEKKKHEEIKRAVERYKTFFE